MLSITQSALAFSSTRIIVSHEALVPPKAPVSDDMRCMVDDLSKFGQIRSKPGAYSLPDGTMIVHPQIKRQLDKRISERLRAEEDRLFFKSMLGRPFHE